MSEIEIPRLAISIQQPWAWLIVNGHKAIENRDWSTRFRGPVAIHAGKKIDETAARSVLRGYHPVSNRRIDFGVERDFETGGIVGASEIVGCVDNSDDEWFVGRYGFMLRNSRPVPLIPVRGRLGFFEWRSNLSEAQP